MSSGAENGVGVSEAAAAAGVCVNHCPTRIETWGGLGWFLSPGVVLVRVLFRVWGMFFGHRAYQSSVSRSWRKDL